MLPLLYLRQRRGRAAGEHHGLGVAAIPGALRRPENQQVGHLPLRLCRAASPAVSRALRRQPPPRTPQNPLCRSRGNEAHFTTGRESSKGRQSLLTSPPTGRGSFPRLRRRRKEARRTARRLRTTAGIPVAPPRKP